LTGQKREQILRLGILGGTFDPIHIGHLRIAEEIREELELKKVYLIPGAMPPHKDRGMVTPFGARLTMAKMAAQDSPFLEALDLEGRRPGLSYSIETLKEIHGLFQPGPELFFIIGMDAFQEIRTWKQYKRLFDYANFVVIKRPGFSVEELESFVLSLDVGFENQGMENLFTIPSGNLLIYKEAALMDISSTGIREMVAAGRSIRFLVPKLVRRFILEKGLYKNHDNSR